MFHLLTIMCGPIVRRNHGHRHCVSVCGTNLKALAQHHKIELHGYAHRSYTQFTFLARIGRIFERVALRHLLSVGNAHAYREASSMQAQSSHQAYRSRKNQFAPQYFSFKLWNSIGSGIFQDASPRWKPRTM